MGTEMEAVRAAPSSIDHSLAEWDTRIQAAERQVEALLSALRAVARVSHLGQVRSIPEVVRSAREKAAVIEATIDAATQPPSLDLPAAFADGSYGRELEAAVADAGGRLVAGEGGRLIAFPLLLQLDVDSLSIRVGRQRERRLRPSVLARRLAGMQKKQRRFDPRRFLDRLFKPYRLLAKAQGHDWAPERDEDGPFVRLSELHDILTLLPAAAIDYPRDAFLIDLLDLDVHPDATSTRGHGFVFAASSGTRGAQVLSGYDRQGVRHDYFAIRFVRRAVGAFAAPEPGA